jgi:hypothetical protein
MNPYASISFTDGQSGKPPSNKPSKPIQKPNPIEQQQRKRLQKQKELIDQKLKKLAPITAPLKAMAMLIQGQDPNSDPTLLFREVRPLLAKMMITNIMVPNKTVLVPGKSDAKGNSQYKVTFRRNAELSYETLDRIRRQRQFFDSIIWTSDGMVMTVLWPYKSPEQPGAMPS